MTPIVCVLTTALASQVDYEALVVRLELAPSKVRIMDPLFARVTVTNGTHESVNLPSDLFYTATYNMSFLPYPYSYRFTSEHVTGSPTPTPAMAPGEKSTVDHEILEFPRTDQLEHTFWQDVVGRTALLQTHVGSRVDEANKLLTHREAGMDVFVNPRPAEEMEFLTGLYAECAKRDKDNVPAEGWRTLGSKPNNFGLTSFGAYPDLVGKLVAYEEHLSPGSLRDVVHLLRLTQTIYHSGVEAERKETAEELLEWLDTLPEIERHCLAKRIITWASLERRDEAAMHILVYGAAQRLPEQLYYREDYRAYRLRQYATSHPKFQAYLKQQDNSAVEK